MSTTMMNILTTSTILIPKKNSDVRKNGTLRNYANNSNTKPNNLKNNKPDKYDINSIDTENNIDNVELFYNCKCCQSDHIIQKYCESLPYAIQFIQKSNTNIYQRKLK